MRPSYLSWLAADSERAGESCDVQLLRERLATTRRGLTLALVALAVTLAAVVVQAVPGAGPVALELKEEPVKPEVTATVFPPRSGWHKIYVLRVVDADTVHAAWMVEDQFRLAGLNAPELKTDAGQAAKKWLEAKLPPRPVTVQVDGPDKFRRTLVTLYDDQNFSINKQMIDAGHAKKWDGKGPKP